MNYKKLMHNIYKSLLTCFAGAALLTLLFACSLEKEAPVGEADALKGTHAAIYINQTLYKKISLDEDQVVLVEQENGKRNEVTVKDRSIFMSHANCDNQDCVHQGEISLENYEKRVLGVFIICLPNAVTIELLPEAQE